RRQSLSSLSVHPGERHAQLARMPGRNYAEILASSAYSLGDGWAASIQPAHFDQALQPVAALGSTCGEEFRAGLTLPRLPAACMARRAAASKPGPASAHARRPESGSSGVLPPLRGGPMSRVGVRYIIDDVPTAVRFYTELLGFTVERDA